uniref:C2H2-type domain-containing protein n=1 Tax=Glossina brevipalpis TaxID=37001 RepID=A0A1A9WM72_9MUSC
MDTFYPTTINDIELREPPNRVEQLRYLSPYTNDNNGWLNSSEMPCYRDNNFNTITACNVRLPIINLLPSEKQVESSSSQASKRKYEYSTSSNSPSPSNHIKRIRVGWRTVTTNVSLATNYLYYHHHCRLCGKRFKSIADMNIHVGRHTTIGKQYKCSECTKQYHHKTDLNRHIKGTNQVKSLGCHLCEMRYCRKDQLNKHILTHLREKK